MGDLKIVEVTNEDRRFYGWIGPFLGSREVHRRLGGPVWDDPGKRWWVALRGGAVVGFCGLAVRGQVAYLESDYVAPEAEDASTVLFESRLKAALELDITLRATVRADAKRIFVRKRFAIVRETENYITFELAAAAAAAAADRKGIPR